MFQLIRCRDALGVHRAQAAPVRPYCINLFGYGSSRHDTVLLVL